MQTKLKLGIIGLAAAYCAYYFMVLGQWHFIDNINLIIHEAGHMVFMPFGHFIMVAGGSLLQLIVPTAFIVYFLKTNQKFSAYFVMFWLAINFFNVGWYAADAQLTQLPLLGGDSSSHDWNYLLSVTGLLKQTKVVAGFIYFLGWLCIAGSVYLAITYTPEPEPDKFKTI